jgi:hypothetical protein
MRWSQSCTQTVRWTMQSLLAACHHATAQTPHVVACYAMCVQLLRQERRLTKPSCTRAPGRLPACLSTHCCSFVAALQQRLAAMPGPSVACLASCMPLLLPSGGALRLWRQVGGLLQEQVVSMKSNICLCNFLQLLVACSSDCCGFYLDCCGGRLGACCRNR